MAEVTHSNKGNGVQMSFYTSLYHT